MTECCAGQVIVGHTNLLEVITITSITVSNINNPFQSGLILKITKRRKKDKIKLKKSRRNKFIPGK